MKPRRDENCGEDEAPVADTQRHTDMAADYAVVKYDTGNLEPPKLSIEEVVDRSSFFDVPPLLIPKQVGDFSKWMREADHKILSVEVSVGFLAQYISKPLLGFFIAMDTDVEKTGFFLVEVQSTIRST